MVTENERNEGKLSRLVERNEKILKEIMKSKTTNLQKADNYQFFGHFIADLCCHLEEKYPYLKRDVSHNMKGKPRWVKPNSAP